MSTPYHAQYFAYDLTRHHGPGDSDRLSMALFDACVDLNPHQIDAAAFALRNPLSKGVLMADEVGLGKTIEAGLVLCQYWAERKRKLLVICPASLRKQWSLELLEKFNLPNVILDSQTFRQARSRGEENPFSTNRVVITSLNFAARMRVDIRAVPFDLVVIDEAHKLRNAHRSSNKMGQNIKWAVEERRKLLLTATPLQNSLFELFGLATVLDDTIFGDINAFRAQYATNSAGCESLRGRLQQFCQRTLRRQVTEYIRYTNRRPLTFRFHPTNDEQKLYEAVSDYLLRENTFAFPKKQRHLTTLILRKLLASSSLAVAGTLETMKNRLIQLRDGLPVSDRLAEELIENEDIEEELLDEILGDNQAEEEPAPNNDRTPSRQGLDAEIEELGRYAAWAHGIGTDTKSRSLHMSLEAGFAKMAEMGAPGKALIFTESRRTQEYLKNFLERNGYSGQIVLFNGTNADLQSRQIIDQWLDANREAGRVSGSRPVDSRTALIEHFRDKASIMIATEAAAEGVNLQFCALVVNYDLPWNPQRIEQRIGRCHRYGQKHDVVVINFLNERNEADQRVHQLLSEKFSLFSGVFGASDEVLGSIESGVDFERRILAIYQECRSTEAIDNAFATLQQDMEESIRTRMDDTRRVLLEQFDEDVHGRLKVRLGDTRSSLDRISRMYWALTRFVLADRANFDDTALAFELHSPPKDDVKVGRYQLISKTHENIPGDFLYRLSHPLGEWVIESGKQGATPIAMVNFDLAKYPVKISTVAALKGQSGWLALQHLVIESYERTDFLLFSGFTDGGKSLDQETCERLFNLTGSVEPLDALPEEARDRLGIETDLHATAAINVILEESNKLFAEERDRLDRWAEEAIEAAERDVAEVRAQIATARRQGRLAATLDEQAEGQAQVRNLDKKYRRLRQEIFKITDEIDAKRDVLIDNLQKRMSQTTSPKLLFTVRWRVI